MVGAFLPRDRTPSVVLDTNYNPTLYPIPIYVVPREHWTSHKPKNGCGSITSGEFTGCTCDPEE